MITLFLGCVIVNTANELKLLKPMKESYLRNRPGNVPGFAHRLNSIPLYNSNRLAGSGFATKAAATHLTP
jgi:hypothetical protein